MEVKEFAKELERMCDTHLEQGKCHDCPLWFKWKDAKTGEPSREECFAETIEQFSDIVVMAEIVEQWTKERPRKTRKDDFFEKYPNAPKDGDKKPKACAAHCGYTKCKGEPCEKCWNEPLEEE